MSDSTIMYISNADVRLGIHVKKGGTIIYLSKNNSENLLCANKELWDTSIAVTLDTDFMPLQGHTIWLGPQSEWWTQQNYNLIKKEEKSVWPPCPIITLDEYSVVSSTDWYVKIQSKHSEIWGVTIEKEIAVNPDGSVFIQVTVINTSDSIKSWDIWHNTRVPGYNRAYIKTSNENCKVVPVLNKQSTEMPYNFMRDFFTYEPEPPTQDYSERSSKAFIYPEEPCIYAFSQNHMLRIAFEKHMKNEIHPEQGLVEIYNHTEHTEKNALLELEYHSPFKKLSPGEQMQAWEVWNVEPYEGDYNQEAHIEFITNLEL